MHNGVMSEIKSIAGRLLFQSRSDSGEADSTGAHGQTSRSRCGSTGPPWIGLQLEELFWSFWGTSINLLRRQRPIAPSF